MTVLPWLVRYGHVLSATIWVGGYALVALVLLPWLRRAPDSGIAPLISSGVRLMTYAGTLTIGFGLALITQTRGFGRLTGGEWGGIMLSCIAIAVALLGIGDGALRPALRRGDGRAAQRWANWGLALTALAVGLMTRAIYAPS